MESGLDMGNWKRLREKGQLKVGVLEMKSVEVLIGSDERKRSKVTKMDSLPDRLGGAIRESHPHGFYHTMSKFMY